MAGKASNIEAKERYEIILEMMIQGARRNEIIRFCSSKWDIGVRMAEKYMKAVNDEIVKQHEKNRDLLIGRAALRFEDLYKKNYKAGDYRECRMVQESLNKLSGLNEPTEVKVIGGVQLVGPDGKTWTTNVSAVEGNTDI